MIFCFQFVGPWLKRLRLVRGCFPLAILLRVHHDVQRRKNYICELFKSKMKDTERSLRFGFRSQAWTPIEPHRKWKVTGLGQNTSPVQSLKPDKQMDLFFRSSSYHQFMSVDPDLHPRN